MIELAYDIGNRKSYNFKPNASCSIYGKFELVEKQDRYEIWSLGIFGAYRGRGYGTQMLTEFLRQFDNRKPLFLYVLKTNEVALRLYQNVGFDIVGCTGDSIYIMQYINCV
jgi:ribosomal protein S18 acetylase RimI-like enzyme